MNGQLGVVSGTALDVVLARKLQLGDPGGHLRRALDAFPIPEISQRVRDQYFIAGGKAEFEPFQAVPMNSLACSNALTELNVLAGYVSVFLAKEGHSSPVGMNLLEKIQLPTLPLLFGAILAGVNVILMGAGIPGQIPGILDRLAQGEPVQLRVTAPGDAKYLTFDPTPYIAKIPLSSLTRPEFLAIVSSPTLAKHLQQKASGKIDGFVVEEPVAGGHNAPPRGKMQLSESGEPVYTERDQVNLAAFRDMGLPFWLAGGFGRPGRLQAALEQGAAGIQVGTIFAFCEESGIEPELKQAILRDAAAGQLKVFTDPHASPTGFPFKVVQRKGSITDPSVYAQRNRVCDLGFLRQATRDEHGKMLLRCPAEPEHMYQKKGGAATETAGRVCLCNGLLATIGIGQVRKGKSVEAPLLTAGDDLEILSDILNGRSSYQAAEVIDLLLSN
jgi:nitronate monooxygenase